MIGSRSAACLRWLTLTTLLFSAPAVQAQSAATPPPAFSDSLTTLARIETGETLYPISLKVSADNAHIAYAAKNPKGMFAAFDSQRGVILGRRGEIQQPPRCCFLRIGAGGQQGRG